MDDLKRIEGKTISEIDENFDGVNSYIIMKFEEGGKLNISSYPNGDEGTGQFDMDVSKLKDKGVIGKRIHEIREEFDGASDYLTFLFKDGSSIKITAFSSSTEGTAGLDYTVYSENKLVAESLNENKYRQQGQYALAQPQYEAGAYNPANVIAVLINSKHKMAFMKIIKELKSLYDNVHLDLELGGALNGPVITIEDEKASVESVSDDLYKYIENGIVYTVDEI